jgi:hypothetical protein
MTPTIFPEYESVESFVEDCLDDDRYHFTTADMQALNEATQMRLSDVRKALEGYGLRFVPRKPRKHIRGFQTGSNDRFYGPGSAKMYGGSGWEQINGFAGDKNSY